MSEFVPYGSRREPQTLALAGRYASIYLIYYASEVPCPIASMQLSRSAPSLRGEEACKPAFLHLHHGSRQSMLDP